jgi:hypothetical protein
VTAPTPAHGSSKRSTIAQAKRVEPTKTSVKAAGSADHEEVAQVEEEVSGIARAGAESPATPPPVASASDEGSSGAPTVVHNDAPSASPASKTAAGEEFGFEK